MKHTVHNARTVAFVVPSVQENDFDKSVNGNSVMTVVTVKQCTDSPCLQATYSLSGGHVVKVGTSVTGWGIEAFWY